MAATKKYLQTDPQLTNPAEGAFSITKSDSVELSTITKAIHSNADGNIAVVFANGDAVTLTVSKGGIYPYQIKQLKSTNTTLADGELIGLV